MKATGLFFLRMRPYTARGSDGALSLLLPVVEHGEDREGRRVALNTLLCRWSGEAAMHFWNLNVAELKPGRGLELELDRLRGQDGEWRAHVTRCALAPLPPSWQPKADAAAPTQPPAAMAA